jgi:hypothetical protein
MTDHDKMVITKLDAIYDKVSDQGNRITVLETEAGYLRKAIIGSVALIAIPFGMACKGFVAWCALPRV